MIFLVEFDVHDGTALTKLFVSTHGITSGPNDNPANQYYEPRMKSVGRIERSMFASGDGVSGGTTTGKAEVGFGNISVINGTPLAPSEYIDHWKNLAFRNVAIKSLISEAVPFANNVTRFIGIAEQLVSTNALEQYDVIIHDRLQDLDTPLLIHTYLGTTNSGGTGTVEGDVDLKDQIKSKIWGTVHNVKAVAVNPFELVYQISDGTVASITTYDGGVVLNNDGDAGSLAALFATAPSLGGYRTCVSLGLVRLGSPPIGEVTCDVVEGGTAASRSAGQIATRMMTWFQQMNPQLSAAIVAADVTALDALNPAQCGILVQSTESALDAFSRLLNSVGAWLLPQSNSNSLFNVGRLDLPTTAAIASYDFDDNIGGSPERIESGDDAKGVPAWKVIVRYDQVATVQAPAALFGVVTENDPVRVQYLGTEWRQASAENAAVKTMWPNAPTITVDTRLVLQANAQTEAARLLTLHGALRDIWKIKVPMSADPSSDPGIGEIIELTSRSRRMGLGSEFGTGKTFRVMARNDDFDEVPTIELTLWG